MQYIKWLYTFLQLFTSQRCNVIDSIHDCEYNLKTPCSYIKEILGQNLKPCLSAQTNASVCITVVSLLGF